MDSKPLNFGSDHGRWLHGAGHVTASGGGVAAYGNGAQGASGTPWALGTAGHSVIFKAGPPSVSQLTVHSATATDSGRYTCQPSSGLPASTQVHVALGTSFMEIELDPTNQFVASTFTSIDAQLRMDQLVDSPCPVIRSKWQSLGLQLTVEGYDRKAMTKEQVSHIRVGS